MGIGIGVTVFVLFLIAVLPNILEHSINQWERLGGSDISEEELHAMFVEHPSYVAMYERFPDAKEEFSYHGGSNGMMTVGVMNFENGNQLVLDMHHDGHADRVEVNVRCQTDSDRHRLYADRLFAEDFIRNTDCLELTGDVRVET